MAASFRWQAFFQRSCEPWFVLNRRRRVLFVNRAWEELTGLTLGEARDLACRRPRPATPDQPWKEILEHLLCPPPEAVAGQPTRARRLVPGAAAGRRGWDVDFLPLRDAEEVYAYLGRIHVVALDEPSSPQPLPEKVVTLQRRSAQRYRLDSLQGTTPASRRLVEQVRLAGGVSAPVLLVGESGSGKEWVARAIHQVGPAREKAFAVVDCAALPPTVLESLLFGEVGLTRRPGIGAVYFKEPARLPRDLQSRLCELLGHGGVRLRILAGTTTDPREAVRSGGLLDELHAALGTLVIAVPPLRERAADLPWLVERLLERVRESDDPPRTVPLQGLNGEAWEVVRAYSWPGNVTELYAALLGAAARAPGARIVAGDLPAHLRVRPAAGPRPEKPLPLDQLLEEAERRLIQLALRRTRGHKSRAADLLGVVRPRLFRRLKLLGLAGDDAAPEAE